MNTIDGDMAEAISKCIGQAADAIRAGRKEEALEKLGHVGIFTLRVNESFDTVYQECLNLKEKVKALEGQQLRIPALSLN